MLFCLPLPHCLLNVKINIAYFCKLPPTKEQVSGKPASILPTLISSKILHPKFPRSICPLPSTSHIPQPTLFLPIHLLSGGARNSPLIPVSVLPFFSCSPWIMPTHLLTDSWFPTRNKFLTVKLHSGFVLHSSTGFPGKKKLIPIHSASSASLRCCDNLHLISQLYQLKK